MAPATRRILLIDDDRILCGLIADYLRPHGFAVNACHHGEEGAARAAAEPWDAVLLDVTLPGLGGYAVLRRIREHSSVPVLMLTARNDESDRITAFDHGADDFVPKIFSQRELRARLDAVLRRVRPVHSVPPEAGPAMNAPLVSGDLSRKLDRTALTEAFKACLVLVPRRISGRSRPVSGLAIHGQGPFIWIGEH